jgi:NTP pyrophosphatase (non-canonical NTP hydrolase)
VNPPTHTFQHNQLIVQIKQRKSIMSKVNKNTNAQQVANAMKIVKAEVNALGEKIRAAAPEDRPVLEKELADLMGAVGMTYVELNDVDGQAPAGDAAAEATGGVGRAMLNNLEQIDANMNASLADSYAAAAAEINAAKLSLWQRFNLFRRANPKKFWSGFAIVVGVIAGMSVYFARAKNTAAVVSSVSGAADITADQLPSTSNDAPSTPIFTKIGDVVVKVVGAIKGYAVAAYTWVKNLFVKTAEVVNESQPVTAAIAA